MCRRLWRVDQPTSAHRPSSTLFLLQEHTLTHLQQCCGCCSRAQAPTSYTSTAAAGARFA